MSKNIYEPGSSTNGIASCVVHLYVPEVAHHFPKRSILKSIAQFNS